MHPLARGWPLATQEVDATFPTLSVPKPMNMEVHDNLSPDNPVVTAEASQSAVSDVALAQAQAPDIQPSMNIPPPIQISHSFPVIAPLVLDAAIAQAQAPDIQPSMNIPPPIQISHSSPVIAPLVLDAAIAQAQAPDIQPSMNIPPPIQISHSSPVITPPISDAAISQAQAPDIQQSMNNPPPMFQFKAQPPSHRPMLHMPRRRNDRSRVMVATDTITEKTRLVEQPDLITRKIIEIKDQKISQLEAQVRSMLISECE
jgi:hypothetical protein